MEQSREDEDANTVLQSINPYYRVLNNLHFILQFMAQLINIVTDVYRRIHNDIVELCLNGISQEANDQVRNINRQVILILLNLFRYFNPQRFGSIMNGEFMTITEKVIINLIFVF